MFWTDDRNNRIWRAKLNGTGASIMISTRLSCPGWTKIHNNMMLKLEESINDFWITHRWNCMGLDQ